MEKSFICLAFGLNEETNHIIVHMATRKTLDDITEVIDKMPGGPANDPPVLYAGSILDVLQNMMHYTNYDPRNGFIAIDEEDEELISVVHHQLDPYFHMHKFLHDGAIG